MSEYKIPIPSSYLEEPEVWAIINSVSLVSRHHERDTLVLWTMWESGGRVSEVLQLKKEQIVSEEKALILVNLKRRGRTEYKRVYISRDLAQNLVDFSRTMADDEYVFKSNQGRTPYLSRNYVWWIVKRAAKAAGIRKENLTRGRMVLAWPHLFRHACAMYVLEKTGSTEKTQRQLGHSSILTTQGYAVLKLRKTDSEISDIFEKH